MDNQPDVEILIHIEAPSKVIDDARYRSLAAAYLGFEPREPIRNFSEQGHHEPDIPATSQLPVSHDDESSVIPSGVRFGSLKSPQFSFRSVEDNADSPMMHIGEIPSHALVEAHTPIMSATQSSWETPPSIVQDSYPMNHTDFLSLAATPTKVLENYLQHFESPLRTQNSPSSRPPTSPTYNFSNPDQTSAENLVPCTPQINLRGKNVTVPPLSDGLKRPQDSSEPRHIVPTNEHSDDNIIVEETILMSSSKPSSPTRADSAPPPQLNQIAHSQSLARTLSDIGPQLSSSLSSSSITPRKAPVTITFLSSHGFTYESLEILAPEPPTSERYIEPQTLITQGLQKLGEDVNITSRFRPKEQTRDLVPYERGYWLLDCSTWEPQLKHDAWAFLANYIGTGIAGWGVRCKRDPDFRELRAYCFGLVAAHIYYVLWLSSQRKIIFTGSSWIDGGGTRVIIMGSRNTSLS
ncbi:hypothetical protein GGS21DRAFT_458356 [Xylaria nigripes]|nr:hypothetical protein GGS21DRAFT_458356 [Xylaria nigripes]